MTHGDVIRDLFQGLGFEAQASRVAFYVDALAAAAPDPHVLHAACMTATRATKRGVPTPAEILAALSDVGGDATPERVREERRETMRAVIDAMDDAVPAICNGTATDLAGRVAWLTVQSRKPGTWGEVCKALLDRERAAQMRALRIEDERARVAAERTAWVESRDAEPPPIGEVAG
jgi:hypothetical protein